MENKELSLIGGEILVITKDDYIKACVKQFMKDNPKTTIERATEIAEQVWVLRKEYDNNKTQKNEQKI